MALRGFFSFSLLLLGTIFILSCSKVDQGAISTPPSTPPTTTTPTPGVVNDSAGFSVVVIPDPTVKAPYVIHKGESVFDVPCTAAQGEQAFCYIEGEESDIFYSGVNFQYNVPTTFCTYVTFQPYYYYYLQTGAGAANVQEDTDKNGTVGIDSNSDGVVDAPRYACPYDYSKRTTPGPNCCTGTYDKVLRTWDATAGAYKIASTLTNQEWGGKASNCLSGPGNTNPPGRDDSGFPKFPMMYTQGIGFNSNYKIASPISLGKHSNIWVSNYYKPVDHGGGTPTPVIQVPYQIQCLDRAYEVTAEIDVFIREWNTQADFNNRVAFPDNHSLTGFEPAPFSSLPLNDFLDWKDFGNSYPDINE